MPASKPQTIGTSPKVPAQAIVAVLAFVLVYFGIELSPEASAAIATLLGIIGGYIAPPGQVR